MMSAPDRDPFGAAPTAPAAMTPRTASAPAAAQQHHPFVPLAAAAAAGAHPKPRKQQQRRPRPKPPASLPQLPHHISQHPLGHMFLNSHSALLRQQFPNPHHPHLPHQPHFPSASAAPPPAPAPAPAPAPSAAPSAAPPLAPATGDPRLAKFDAATLEHVMRTTNDPNIYAALSNQLNFLRARAASQPASAPQHPFQSQPSARSHQLPLLSAHHNPLLHAQNFLHKQQLYNHHQRQQPSNIQRPVAPEPPAQHSAFPLATNPAQDPLSATLSRDIRSLPPHLRHQFQAGLQSRQLQASQLQRSKPTSTHSQASHATHSNSTSRRRSPSNSRPPRHGPNPVADANAVASSTSGARANPNHPLSNAFEDTQSVASLRQQDQLTAMRSSDSARRSHHFSSTSTQPAINPAQLHTHSSQLPPERPIAFEIDAQAIRRECERVLRERELQERANQKKRRLQQRPWNDYHRVHNPDYRTPFHGLVDAFERIVPFHVLFPPEEASVSSEEWAKCTDQLCDKYSGFYSKLRTHCNRLHDASFEAVGDGSVLGQSSLTTEDSIIMERILLDDYYQTVQREAALARKRAADEHAKKMAEVNRQNQLLQSQVRHDLSLSQPSPSQSVPMSHLPQHPSLHPGPQAAFQAVAGQVGVSNGSVSASHDIVSARAQAAMWRQPIPNEMRSTGVARTASAALGAVNQTPAQQFAGTPGAIPSFVNVAQRPSSGSSLYLANQPTAQTETNRYLLTQSQLQKSMLGQQVANEQQKAETSALADSSLIGEQENVSNDLLGGAHMSGAIHRTNAGSTASQVSDGAVRNGGHQIPAIASGSNSAVDESSVAQGGASGVGVAGNGDLLAFNNGANVSGLGNGDTQGNASSINRNGVSSGGTPQSIGVQDSSGMNMTSGSGGNVASIDGSLDARSMAQVGSGGNCAADHSENKLQAHEFGQVEASVNAEEGEMKRVESSELRRESESPEANALAMGSLLNSDGG